METVYDFISGAKSWLKVRTDYLPSQDQAGYMMSYSSNEVHLVFFMVSFSQYCQPIIIHEIDWNSVFFQHQLVSRETSVLVFLNKNVPVNKLKTAQH